ncbi:MAG: Na/Pi cotransporter family protein [Clostridia bacterium]|nr:Na/Pi cotransporter family protein [Clostridia bacterium]
MTIFDVLQLFCGLALFLYGMNVMGDSLKKSAGKSLKTILATLTSSTFKGFMLGLLVTLVIQSSSATTVMVVGFVNSGTMTLTQAIGVIMGANVGTAVTAWITGLSGLGEGGQAASEFLKWLKPDSWMPILAVIGLCLTMFAKRDRKKDIGAVLLGFSVLMVGMDMMSGAVSGLKSSESFKSILTMFENPILGILAGLVLTAIVQSSSASVGILQSLTTTGAITYGAAIPIVMGQNIGTCVTALISSFGASKNAKRAALAHLYFNVVGVVFWMSAYSILNAIFSFAFVNTTVNMWGVAGIHTVFKILSVILIMPFSKQLEKLAVISVKDSKEEENLPMLEERLLNTPAIAVESAKTAATQMAALSCDALSLSLKAFAEYDDKLAEQIRAAEDKADIYEDMIGSYLIKLSAKDTTAKDSHEITKLLHIIGDFERISDHAVNILESAEEMRDKKLEFSSHAQHELKVLSGAIDEIIQLAKGAFMGDDLAMAAKVEPLEEVVDYIKDQIKRRHILRLQKSECSIEHGFVLADILNNMERVADHCSNIAGCVIEISQHDSLSMHSYLSSVRAGGEEFDRANRDYMRKYSLDEVGETN